MNQVIFAPDLIGAAFIDPHAHAVLERWRDGQFKTILNRQLLLLHLKTLRELGLPPHLLKRWTLWLTSPEKSNYLSELESAETKPSNLCELIPNAPIICSAMPPEVSNRWISANEFLRQDR